MIGRKQPPHIQAPPLPSLVALDATIDAAIKARKPRAETDPLALQERNQPGAFEAYTPQSGDDGERAKAGKQTRRRKYSTVMDRYRASWLADKGSGVPEPKRRGVSPDQHNAGERFSEDYRRAVASLSAKGMNLTGVGGGSGGWEFAAGSHEAVDRAYRAMSAGKAGQISARVVQRVCGHDESVRDVEAALGWPNGHAIVRTRDGNVLNLGNIGKLPLAMPVESGRPRRYPHQSKS
jgi:hypothetical protein